MLGKRASASQIEDQALILMDLSDRAIHASLSRLGGGDAESTNQESMDEDPILQEMLEAEGMAEAPESMAEEKMARLFDQRISRIEAALGRSASRSTPRSASRSANPTSTKVASTSRRSTDDALLQEMLESEGMDEAPESSTDDALLNEMLKSEGMAPESMNHESMAPESTENLEAMLDDMMGDEDLLLGEMLMDEGMVDDLSGEYMLSKPASVESMMPMSKDPAAEAMGEEDPMVDPMMDPTMESPLEDPMGMFEDGMDEEERSILAKIFRGAGEEPAPVVESEEAEEVPAAKTARLRPQPKRASAGPARLGGVSKSAATDSEMNELSKLWESSPDVSKYFG
jgi:hypothetical protein